MLSLLLQSGFSLKCAQVCRGAAILPMRSVGSKSLKEPQKGEDAEIDKALEIEGNLFENSSLRYNPVVKRSQAIKKVTTPNVVSRASKRTTVRQPQIIDDTELGLQFERLSCHDPKISTLMTTIRSRKRRDKNREIIIEGRRLIQEALSCQLKMHALLFSKSEQLNLIKDAVSQAQGSMQAKIYKVQQHELKSWSTLTTPPGLMAIFERPSEQGFEKLLSKDRQLPITVVCDNIREPNNLGSIIRTCAATSCAQVIVTRGCCDPWESKALRGGCGGHFRVRIRDSDWEEIPLLIPPETADDCCVFIAENNIEKLENKALAIDYSDLSRVGTHNVLIIGGESHGVSDNAYRLLDTVGLKGNYLFIPVANGADSLNVTSALTLILYELKKHLPKICD